MQISSIEYVNNIHNAKSRTKSYLLLTEFSHRIYKTYDGTKSIRQHVTFPNNDRDVRVSREIARNVSMHMKNTITSPRRVYSFIHCPIAPGATSACRGALMQIAKSDCIHRLPD